MDTQSDRGWVAVLVAPILVTLAAASVAPAQVKFSTLVNFDGASGDEPTGSLVQGLDGNISPSHVAGYSDAFEQRALPRDSVASQVLGASVVSTN